MKNRHYPGFTLLVILIISLFTGCKKQDALLSANQPSNAALRSEKAPLLQAVEGARYVEGSYFVIFQDAVTDVDDEVSQINRSLGIRPQFVYHYAVKGFAAMLPATAIEALQNNPNVKYIEQDQVATLVTTQTNPPSWGLDRIDQPSLPLDATYVYNYTGSTLDAYIFDTGIRFGHEDFGGRAATGYDAITPGGTAEDANGHGTHVAGTVGGTKYGVAKAIQLYAVRVLGANGSGTYTQVVAGLDWAVGHHTTKPAVGNMSLGGGASSTLDVAVRNVVADGIVLCVAAGNSYADAINYSPARVAEAITVGATSGSDGFASFSNYGSIVDILAPGVSITSAWYTSNTATNTISGTSMATPHVAGAAALYLEANPGFTPAQVEAGLKSNASINKISGVPAGTVNFLLYLSFGPPPPPPSAPVLSSPADGSTNVPLSASVSWNVSTGATVYNAQLATDAGFTNIVSSKTGLTGISTTFSGLATNTTYYWRVNAGNGGGTSTWSSVWSFTTQTVVIPSVPSLSYPADGATGVSVPVRFSWSSASGAATYHLQVSLYSDFHLITTNKAGVAATSVNVGGLKKNTRYYWRVRSLAADGVTYSSWSSVRSFTSAVK